MSAIMEKTKSNDRVAEASKYEDALFVVHVQPKDETTDAANGNSSASVGVLTELMPSGTTPLVIADARGGMAARQPSRVQLLTKAGVSVALFSHTLAAETVADAFLAARDAHHDPRARATALKEMLSNLHEQEHSFSLAAFDDSARAFVAWTPRSAPISFGHHADGSVVVVGANPRSKTLVGKQGLKAGDVQLAHLPAGRFVYGHGFLKPFEFTSMWSTATGNRAGAPAQVDRANHHPVFSSPSNTSDSAADLSSAELSADFSADLDKPKLTPEESSKWRWAKTGSRAEESNSWKKKITTVVAAAAEEQVVPVVAAEQKMSVIAEEEAPTVTAATLAASQIAAIAEAVAARTSSVVNDVYAATAGATFIAPKSTAAVIDWAAWPEENPILAAASSKLSAHSSSKFSTSSVNGSVEMETAAQRLLTFGVGAVICNAMAGGAPRINRFDTHADKRFMTLLLLRVAAMTAAPFSDPSERRAQMLQALTLGGELGLGAAAAGAAEVGVVSGAMRRSLLAAVRKSAKAVSVVAATKTKRALGLALPARKSASWGMPSRASASGSSIVTCSLNGTCCIGSSCFV